MLKHTAPTLKPSIQALGNNVGNKFRQTLRELEVVHIFKHDNKVLTFDVPFSLKISKSEDSIIILVDKDSLPRGYSSQSLIEAKESIETSIGMQIQILDRKDILAFCCQISDIGLYPIAV